MSDPRETLAHIRAQVDAATEGPWEWAGKQVESFPQGENSLIAQGDPEREVIGSWGYDAWGVDVENPADAEFIAAARTTVPALLDALEKVLELHQPVGEEVIPWDCAEGDCDHEDDEHPLDTATLCGECYRLAVEVSPYYGENGCSAILWPCPTVKAITDALDTSH